jgi:hypothetical protein
MAKHTKLSIKWILQKSAEGDTIQSKKKKWQYWMIIPKSHKRIGGMNNNNNNNNNNNFSQVCLCVDSTAWGPITETAQTMYDTHT